jgi:protein-S-isoprenylcysteine O-methyltransferase Ste14
MPSRMHTGLARAYAVGASLAFVLALVSLVVLDRRLSGAAAPADRASLALADILFDVALFSLFAVHHSVMARTGLKAWLIRYVHPALERATYVWVASALVIAVCVWWRPIPYVLYGVDAPWAWLLTAARVAGVWMTIDAASRIDPRELAGLRQAWAYGVRPGEHAGEDARVTGASLTEADAGGPLASRGGYRLVRHPLYLGWILMVWGVPTFTGGRLVFAAISTVYLLVAIPLEERSLRERYGHAYRAYEAAVRWRVLPGVY